VTPGAQMQGRREATLTATAYRFAPDAIAASRASALLLSRESDSAAESLRAFRHAWKG